MLKYVKYCLKTENNCLKTQIKPPITALEKEAYFQSKYKSRINS